MRASLLLLPLLLVGLAFGCATAPPPPSALTPEEQRIERLLAAIQLPEFAASLEEVSLRVAGFPRDGELPEDQRLRPRIETQLEPSAVTTDVARRVAKDLDEDYVGKLEHFYASALGHKARVAAGTPYSWSSRLGYRLFGGLNDDSPERVALVEKLAALTLSSQTTNEAYLTVYQSIVRWYETKGFVDDKESAAVGGTDALIAREREKVDALNARHTIPFGLYALSDLSTPELSEYVAQAGSPASQWFAKSVREELNAAIHERSATISR